MEAMIYMGSILYSAIGGIRCSINLQNYSKKTAKEAKIENHGHCALAAGTLIFVIPSITCSMSRQRNK